jgi:acetate CoA/acetoacetate CoA-transferase alpha subunit
MRTISLEQAVAMIPDGASLMIGGFMAVGTPERIIDEIVRQNRHDLTVIANDTAMPGKGVGKLVDAKLLRKAIVSHIGLNPETQRQMMGAIWMSNSCRRALSSSASAPAATVWVAF